MATHVREFKNSRMATFYCYCYVKKASITARVCLSISSKIDNNRKYCKKNKCGSPHHLCIRCVTANEVEVDSIVEKPGDSLCKRHSVDGYAVSRGDNPKKERIRRQEILEEVERRVRARSVNKNR